MMVFFYMFFIIGLNLFEFGNLEKHPSGQNEGLSCGKPQND